MAGAVIEAEGLRKEYRSRRRRTVAVDSLDLSVPAGGVFGFLGPNGAGKTTTIRCLLGLVRPSAGHVRLLGADCQRELVSVIDRVGSIVETPALFPGFSGRRNLRLLAATRGVDHSRVDEVLETVGLSDRASDLVSGYSLGMRQRLGLGAALLRDPEILILDEPANGLDPAGIREMRELIRRLGREGRTVFVSSHLLSEVQLVCDRVAILAKGRCIASGPVSEVLSTGRSAGVIVKVDGQESALSVLREAGMTAATTADGSGIRVEIAPVEAARVTEVLALGGLYLRELRAEEVDLETVFLELTEGATSS